MVLMVVVFGWGGWGGTRLLVAHVLHYCVYLCLSLSAGGCVGR